MEPERRSDTRLELRGGCQCGSVRYAARIEDDEEYVAKWKAAHGQDSMPGLLFDPSA